MTSLTDPAGNTTAWVFDGLNRVTSETNALNDSRSYTYDAAGNTRSITDRDGRVREFTYDDLNRQVAERWYDAPTTHNLLQTIATHYDLANRVESVAEVSPANVTLSQSAYTYDALDRVTA